MGRTQDGRDEAATGVEQSVGAGAAGKRSLVASRYPALGKAIQSHGGEGEPTIHDAATAAVDHKDGGTGVDPSIAAAVGGYLGADLSGVRVHGDPLAREASSAMGARAFAYGSDVFLGPGESGGDLGLMAHELTHVVQQGAAGQRAPQRQVQVGDAHSPAEAQADAVSAAVVGGARPAAMLVDDGPVGPGQMLKASFLDALRVQVTATANTELGPVYSAVGCPYIEQYFGRYAGQPAAASEALLRKFAPEVRACRTAGDMIPLVVDRVRVGVAQWRDTGKPPAELIAAEPAAAAIASPREAAAAGGTASEGAAGPGAATPTPADVTPQPTAAAPLTLGALEQRLGPGEALDGATAARLGDALGTDLTAARIHTGAKAARFAADAGATAVTVGPHVMFSPGSYAPGTLEGDALLAHELAHVDQQAAASAAPEARAAPIASEHAGNECEADQIAEAAVARMAGGRSRGLWARMTGAARSGLSLQRCSKDAPKAAAETKAEKLARLKKEKAELEAIVAPGSGRSMGEVGSAYTRLKDVSHDLQVLETGTGIYEGNKCATTTPGAIRTDCTDIVLKVLGETFAQQGKAADWAKVQAKYKANTTARGDTKLSGMDVQAALQSECGWKGIYWAPDPAYQVPKPELAGARSDEASYTSKVAGSKGTYYKDYHKDGKTKGYPGVSIDQSVTNYAPEQPNPGHGAASTTSKDTGQLDKLKKLPFGVLSAHAGFHMTLITYGKVIEVHWAEAATSVDVVQQTDLEQWAVGPNSGFHYYASGAIVAPSADVDAAFK